MAFLSPPKKTGVLVIGGGPAGSYSAALLAKDGFKVALLERDIFPRYHIGESLLPSARQFLSLVDAEDLVQSHGFTLKPGAAFKLDPAMPHSYTNFVEHDPNGASWNVIRSEFDHILLNHAASCGVDVFEGVKITKVNFDDAKTPRPISADWQCKSGACGTIEFQWLVDASGRAGIISSQYLHARRVNSTLQNVACWAYWTGGAIRERGTSRENAPWFEVLTDQTGWAWYIPLHNGTHSVGFVMSEASSVSKKNAARLQGDRGEFHSSVTQHYLDQLQFTPNLRELLKDAELQSSVKSASDYSYSASTYAGDHFRIIGDAAAFIDPLFSSGVHLALAGGLSAACTIAASSRRTCSEAEASNFHNLKVSTAYTRFLVVVMAIYKQIRGQSVPVLRDIEEESFDRAFVFLRPVIQGAGDVGKELTEGEVQTAMDFFANVFAPAGESPQDEIRSRVDPKFIASDGPILLPEDVRKIVPAGDDEAMHMLNKLNARKPLREVNDVRGQFSREVLGGFVLVCSDGRVGLAAVHSDLGPM